MTSTPKSAKDTSSKEETVKVFTVDEIEGAAAKRYRTGGKSAPKVDNVKFA